MQTEKYSQFTEQQNIKDCINEIFSIEPPARWEIIYNQINGLNEPDVCEWVQDESSLNGKIGPLIEEIYQARTGICERTGLDPDTDLDFCLFLRKVEELAHMCGKLMYCYGYQDGINGE